MKINLRQGVLVYLLALMVIGLLSGCKNGKYDELMTTVEYYSETTGQTRKANVILPAGYDESKEYPVLYLLHGLGGDHKEWLAADPLYIIGNLIETGQAEEMIVVMPNVRARKDDSPNPPDVFTLEHYKAFDNFINDLSNDLMPYIEANYSIKKGRKNTAIAGLSMGGRESLYIGFTLPEKFGYIGAFSPAYGILPYTNFGITEEGLFTEETFKLPEKYSNNTYVMIVTGKSDTLVKNEPFRYHQALEDNGVEHVYYERAGGHDFTVWRPALDNFVKNIFHD
jgi:enterochelin esterase-like enzyme